MSESLPLHELQHASFPSFTISQSLLRFMSVELVMLSNHLILCCPLLLLPSIFPIIRFFSYESALCIGWLKYWSYSINSVQSLSRVWLFATPYTTARQASLFITQFPKFTQIHVHWVGDAIQPSHPLPSPSPPAFKLSQHQIFSNESILCIRWPKYWHFSLSISPANEYSGLISFSMDWLDLLAVQGTLKNLLQHHSSKASILWHSAFFIVHLSHPYMTIGKTIALTRQTFVGKVMSLLFNMLFRLIITFLSGSKCLLISWMQSPSAVILEPPKIKFATVSNVSPSICHEVMGLDAIIFVFWMLHFKPTF